MQPDDRILAWIKPQDGISFEAGFVAAAAASRAPAMLSCSSSEEARNWVELQAQQFGARVEWVEPLS